MAPLRVGQVQGDRQCPPDDEEPMPQTTESATFDRLQSEVFDYVAHMENLSE